MMFSKPTDSDPLLGDMNRWNIRDASTSKDRRVSSFFDSAASSLLSIFSLLGVAMVGAITHWLVLVGFGVMIGLLSG